MGEREIKLRCIELAAQLLAPNRDPSQIIAVSNTLYASLPPGDDASKTKKNIAKHLQKDANRASQASGKAIPEG